MATETNSKSNSASASSPLRRAPCWRSRSTIRTRLRRSRSTTSSRSMATSPRSNDVSFSVKEGEIFGLLGPNGAGKSTLIRMMTTLIPITSGHARIAGHDVAKEPNAARRMIGVIPQALTSDLDLTVEENMNIYAKLYDVPGERAEEID